MEVREHPTPLTQANNTITGLAVPYNRPTTIPARNGSFTEVIRPGAGKAGKVLRVLVKHNGDKLLARSDKGTVQVRETPEGKAVDITVPDTTEGRDAAANIANGNYDGFSWSMENIKERWSKANGITTREILDFDMAEITITDRAAYPTKIELREMPVLHDDDELKKLLDDVDIYFNL